MNEAGVRAPASFTISDEFIQHTSAAFYITTPCATGQKNLPHMVLPVVPLCKSLPFFVTLSFSAKYANS
jgi:hypothetical protein